MSVIKFRLVLAVRLLLTLIGLAAILLAIHFIAGGPGQSGRIRIPVAGDKSAQTPATSSASDVALPATRDNVKYALLVGQYANESEAQAMASRVGGTALKVTDNAGTSWWATLVGPYESVQDARDHANDVAARLKTSAVQIPVVKWPSATR